MLLHFRFRHLRAWRNAAHLSVLVCTAALAGYGFAGVNSKQSAGSGAVPQRPAGADRLEHRRFCCRRRHYGRADLTKLGQRWLPGKLRGTTLIPGDVKLITVPALAAFLVIAVISPYKSLRYVYHLQPLEALFCGCGLFSILDMLRAGTRKRILQIVCLAMVVLAFVIEPERMYSGTYKIDKELEQYSQAAAWILPGTWQFHFRRAGASQISGGLCGAGRFQ